MNKHARAIRDEYGIPYSTALRWIRDLGPDGALDLAEKSKVPQQETARDEPDPAVDVK